MLDHHPKFRALSHDKKLALTRRIMKVYAAHRHPERGAKLHEEFQKIYTELGISQAQEECQ